jgi:hypothetical protein
MSKEEEGVVVAIDVESGVSGFHGASRPMTADTFKILKLDILISSF